jgi:hypothetical protein
VKATPIPAPIRKVVRERADGNCERCGRAARLELHHRQFLSRGGEHTVENIVALCGRGNHSGCHGWAHTEGIKATAAGYQIPSKGNPVDVPIKTTLGWWFRLGERRQVMNENNAIEYMVFVGQIRTAA